MVEQAIPPSRKTSTPWERLRPARQDPLESMGFVSRGDTKLLDPKVQQSFYHKIVNRYMMFCTRHSQNLEAAFASLSLQSELPSSSAQVRDTLCSSSVPATMLRPQKQFASINRADAPVAFEPTFPAETSSELSSILLALRKLREAMRASPSTAVSSPFAQQVHVFNIRLAILALHSPSYHPSLLHLLYSLHTAQHPLPKSEHFEMITYLILDLACRQRDLVGAFALRWQSKQAFDYERRDLDRILAAIVTGNWVSFWRLRGDVDGYVRALLHWQIDELRKNTLKCIGRSYLTCPISWILRSVTGSEMSWEELVAKEDVGWVRNGELITIRKPKPKVVGS